MSTIKASIAGIAFVFERSAFQILDDYLKRIEAGYKYSPDGAEIVADIEARIAELLLSEQEADKVVGEALARRIVEQLGYPDDLNPTAEEVRSLPRRLYRNPEGAILGGVCSGLATYFGIDAVWLRLAVVLSAVATPIFGGFTGVFTLAYLILWLVVPMARTPRQKLEMTGAPITAERIEQQFRAETNTAFSNVNSQRSASFWAQFLYVLGRIFMVFVKVVVGIILFAFIMVAIGITVAIVAVLTGEGYLPPITEGMSISSEAFVVMILFAVLIPFVLLVYSLGTALFNGKVRRAVSLPLGILWIVLVVFISVISVRNHKVLESNWDKWEQADFDYDFDFDGLRIKEGSYGTYDQTYFDYSDSTENAVQTDSLTTNKTDEL